MSVAETDPLAVLTTGPPRKLLTPGEVAAIFRVDPKTVNRWTKAGKLDSIKTPGGHHRFRKDDVLAFVDGLRVVTPQRAGTSSSQ
jgi:excisionase family DNA binding protein